MSTKEDIIEAEEGKIYRLNQFISQIEKITDEEIIAKGEDNCIAFLIWDETVGFQVEYDIVTEKILRTGNARFEHEHEIQNYTLRAGKEKCLAYLKKNISECEIRIKSFKA